MKSKTWFHDPFLWVTGPAVLKLPIIPQTVSSTVN
jgi:hypothetical protein